MRRLLLPAGGAGLELLCLGAHADDIEIGCGGTLLRLAAEVPGLRVRWVVFSGDARRAAEARRSAAAFLAGAAEAAVEVLGFRDGYFPAAYAALKDRFEALKRECRPDLVLSHHPGDAHQDHRTIAELTASTFRDHLVLGYEVPKYDGDLGQPNVFVALSHAQGRQKIAALRQHFASQHGRAWFTDDTFHALARLRGIECNAPDGIAEAFYARKIVLGP
jgi:LmbE family N-acetylglucosaminyl deacetylase